MTVTYGTMRTPSILAGFAAFCGSLSAQPAAHTLDIAVLAGHDTAASFRGDAGPRIKVRVTDGSKPVENATVTAILPNLGAGGVFRGGETIRSEKTDSNGEAAFPGFRLRRIAGDYPVTVVARSGERTGRTVVKQQAVDAEPARVFWTRRRVAMAAIVGGGVAAAIAAVLTNAEAQTPTAAFQVRPGQPVAGGPR